MSCKNWDLKKDSSSNRNYVWISNIYGRPPLHKFGPYIVRPIIANWYRILEVGMGFHKVQNWFPIQPYYVYGEFMVKDYFVLWVGHQGSERFLLKSPVRFSRLGNPPYFIQLVSTRFFRLYILSPGGKRDRRLGKKVKVETTYLGW